MKELRIKDEVTLKETVEKVRDITNNLAKSVGMNSDATLVGIEYHFVCDGVLMSQAHWAEGFRREDYEE